MSPLVRLVGMSLAVPVEIGTRVFEQFPAVAERVRSEIVLARFIGKLAVDHGVEELRDRLHPDVTGMPEPRVSPIIADDGSRDDYDTAADIERPQLDTLALADYEHLSSAQIVAKLDGLDRAERDAIERYEHDGRHRRTVLGKLDQLRSEP